MFLVFLLYLAAMKMTDYLPDDRPRERLRRRGAKSLSNTELIAILLGSGTGGKNVMEVAHELLSCADGRLSLLGAMPLERLMQHKGVGEVRAIAISAAIELGRRSFEEMAITHKRPLTTPDLIYQLMLPTLKHLDHEECWALYLNRKNYLLGKEKLSSGRLESTDLEPRRVVMHAIEKQSSHVILVHNHVSGDPSPSEGDIRQTTLVRKALASVEIALLDHVIVAEDSFYSFDSETITRK